MKIKDLLSTNCSYDVYRDDAVCILAEFAEKQCYSTRWKTYFLVGKLQWDWREQLETQIIEEEAMVDIEVDKLFDFSMSC